MAKIRPALIFDFGNVVAYFDYAIACETLGRPLGISGEKLLDHLREKGLTPLVHRFERGDISEADFSKSVGEIAGLKFSSEAFAAAWADIFQLNESVAALMPSLKNQGYLLILGSNTNAIHARKFRRQFAHVLRHFDKLILSFEVRHLKPSKDFYLACSNAAGCPPEDCLFIDDIPENVQGALAAGLDALLYRDTPTLISDLHERGVTLLR